MPPFIPAQAGISIIIERVMFDSWVPAVAGTSGKSQLLAKGGSILDGRSSQSGTGSFFERRNSGLNSLDW